ncbi:NEAT domain-containing protein [Paenibacillus sp. UNC451MF]|uniref:NEAT domain-containing protein n=1 Tax=Paenibacillus sp. UNC451MF TaxID=1449063 RepID=UPI00048D9B4F|nr:NEAT domain-containing protein [Paenibacillus sp. UNC451MF]
MNRQFRKVVLVFLMLFVVLATIQVPVSQAADSQVAKLTTASDSAYAGNTTDFTLAVSGVTQSVYQQVYGSKAVITFDPTVLDYVSSSALDNKLQLTTDESNISAGQIVVTTSLKNSSQPVSINAADSSFVKLSFKPKATSQAANTNVMASQISIINGQGNSLLFQNVSKSITVLPAGNNQQSLPDGEYKIGYTIFKKNSNEPSVMFDYVDKDSGVLTVQGEKKYVSLTLKQSAEILSFKTEKNGALVETTTVSNDTTANSRVVRFEVDDLASRLNGWVKIYWVLPAPIGVYDHEYEIEIGLDSIFSEYDMNFTTLHATEDKPSSMEKYFVKPGKLKIQQGQKLMSFTIKDSTTIPSFKVEQNGTLVETTIASTNTTDNTRVVQFPVNDLTTLLKARVHISTLMPNGTPYEMDHDIRLRLDVGAKTALNALIADAQSKHDAAVEGTANGQYSAGSKNSLLAAIQLAKIVADNVTATQTQVDQAVAELQAAVTTFTGAVITNPGPGPGEIPDGSYNIGFTIFKKDSNEPSVMYDYVDKSSGKLTVQGGKKVVSFKLNQSAEILSFKTKQNGALVETTTVSSDTAANTRVVQFEVNDLTAKLDGWVKIYWVLPAPIGIYDHEYDVQIGFDSIGSEYDLNYTTLHATQDKPSSMEKYFVKPGKLKVLQGQKLMTFTIKDSATIPSFKLEQNGALVETTIVSTNTTDNTRVVQFPVNDLTALLNARVHISTHMPNGTPYEMDHDIRLRFDVGTKTALSALIADAQSKHDAAVEGTANGQYPSGSKSTLLAAIQQAKAVADNVVSTQTQVDQAVADLQTALTTFKGSVITNSGSGSGTWPDGEYNAKFTIYKKGSEEPSVMLDYVNKDSGKVTVKDGKKYVSLKLTQSAEILSFKTKQSGSLVETSTVSSDAAANTRIVQFEVNDLTAKLEGWVKIYWVLPEPIGIYDHEYDVDLAFSDITVDLSKPIKDGQYSFNYTVSSDEAGADFSGFAEPTGTLKVQSGKKLASLKLKDGVTVTKIQQILSDGSKQDVVPQIAAKQSGVVRVLANESSTKEVQFEVNDLMGVYLIDLKAGDGTAHSFKLSLNKVSPVSTIDPSTPPGGGGNTGGGSGSGGGGVTNPSSLTDGKYTMNYTIKKYGTDERSVMQDYVVNPGILTVDGGKQYFSFTIKQSKEITDFKTEVGGSLTDVEVLSRDEEKNTRDVQFEVADLSSRLKGWVKVDWKEFNYFHNYDIEITFDKSSAKKVSSSTTLSGGGSVVASLKDGEYDLEFKVLQYRNNLESIINDYVLHPAKLIVKDGKRQVALTLNRHTQMTDFKVESEKMIEATEYMAAKKEIVMESATVDSTNAEENKRVVKFEMKDFTKALHAQVEMSEIDEEAAAKQEEAQAQAKNSDDEEEFVNTQPPMKKELIDVDILFDIDALGKKPGEDTVEQPTDPTEQPTDPMGQTTGMKDIQTHWAKTLIERAVALGIVNGYEDGTFQPDSEVSRAEFTAMIGRALKLQGQTNELSFADSDRIPSWVKPTLAQAVNEGIISSYEDQTFRAERKITRSEIAVMIARALKLSDASKAVLPFADAEEIPQWARAQVTAAVELGMINGRENNLFAPNASATRAEAVTLILAMLNNVKE